MAPIWNPRAVLDVDPQSYGFTCVGTTKKGKRCGQFMISNADKSEASQILNNIAALHPTSRAVSIELPELAGLTLCPRWHRKPGYCQVTQMVQKWQRAIENYCNSITATRPITASRRRPESVSSVATGLSENVHARRPSLPSSAPVIDDYPSPSTPRRSTTRPPRPAVSFTPPASPERSLASLAATVPRTPASSSPLLQLPTPPTTRSPRPTVSSTPPASPEYSPASPGAMVPRTPTSSSTLSRLPTPPTTPTSSHNASAAAISPTDTVSSSSTRQTSVNATNTLTPSTPATPTPVPTPCSSPHRSVRRKPITENCCICLDPICCPDEAVWCRAQCGQNVHRECFGTWRRQSLRQARERRMDDGEEPEDSLEVINCVFCRRRWKWEWEE